MLAEQVVQLVAAGYGLGGQVLVVKLLEMPAGGAQGDAVEGGGGVGVDAGARDQAEPAEQPLLGRIEILIRQVERGRDRYVLGPHYGKPVADRCQVGG